MRVRIGRIWLDSVTIGEALEEVRALVESGRGGSVFTPNVDHVVNAETDDRLYAAYGRTTLSIADGQPLVWASRLLGTPLPERVAGSDLFGPLMELAAARRFRVYLLGGSPGAAERAAAKLSADPGVDVVGAEGPFISLDVRPDEAEVVRRIAESRPQLVLVGLGAPKQELFIDRNRARFPQAVCLGVGATLDFAAGMLRRAPHWMRHAGLEWLYRLGQEPRRLARRYLWNDPKFAAIVLRTLLTPMAERVMH